MKNLILLLFIGSLSNNVFSQDFGKKGTEWYYTYHYAGWEYPKYLKSIKDTLVHGKIVHKILDSTYHSSRGGYQYFYQSNDTVFHYLPSIDSFFSLYIFNVNAGDTITLRAGYFSVSSYRMVIDTVYNITIDGVTLKKFNSRGIDGITYSLNGYDTVIEGIGSLTQMFPQSGFALGSGIRKLRCYRDSLIDTNFTTKPCDYQFIYSINEKKFN